MPDTPLITAYRLDNGAKVAIPPHWLDDEQLGAPFTVEEPLDGFTVSELRDLAAERQVDLGDATRKDAIIATLRDPQPVTTPDSGDSTNTITPED